MFNMDQQAQLQFSTGAQTKYLKAFKGCLSQQNYQVFEKGNKIYLPPSCVNYVEQNEQMYKNNNKKRSPLLLCLSNLEIGTRTFVGIQEFTAPEGTCRLPFWLFNQLQLYDGQQVSVAPVRDLPKGTFIKIQPHTKKFTSKKSFDYMEKILTKQLEENYFCLTKGQYINIYLEAESEFFKINILDIKPQNSYDAINIFDSTLAIEFDKALDDNDEDDNDKKNQQLKIPIIQKADSESNNQKVTKDNLFQGVARNIKGDIVNPQANQQLNQSNNQKQDEWDPRQHRLPHGIRMKIESDEFSGKGQQIGSGVLQQQFQQQQNKKK